jgi:glycosyltransferase involved in cell wall biosynthesis
MNNEIANSSLNRIIPPEIKNDEFYTIIQEISSKENIKTVLEIGSSSGEGSTEAFVTGLRQNPNNPRLFCMEISQTRFAELKKKYENDSFVKCYNVSSVSLNQFPDEEEIIDFYHNTINNLRYCPIEQVLDWLRQDIEYVRNSGVPGSGIKKIKQENQIDFFDLVLIDGSEFTGIAELEEVYGAKFIFLDDITTFKNYYNHQKLLKDPKYLLVAQNTSVRNGYSVFKKYEIDEQVSDSNSFYANYTAFPTLPIHFFTIVLNGEPFIRYHIEVFKQIPFKWHWHIVEGVAELKHDTSWSVPLGGSVSDAIHKNGRSHDGTKEYLDELAKLYPDNVTIYRKPENIFWDGKREMVNAPLVNIQEECLLWQVDVDEFWTLEKICQARAVFINNPEKTAAFYYCWYFVGEKLIISTRNCYAHPPQEWLRTWRFKPGAYWAAHEPPRLVETLPDGRSIDLAYVNPFTHQETESIGLVFQHFAYVTSEQLQFKEQYYGYSKAVSQWTDLQVTAKFPVLLRNYFGWVRDETMVDTAESYGIVPILQKEVSSSNWRFLRPKEVKEQAAQIKKITPVFLIDGVFFQLYQTGIARVWKSLLTEWSKTEFGKHIIILDRAGKVPKIPGIKYRYVEGYNYDYIEANREILQQICDEEGASVFISSYYTTPLTTPSVFMAHDMIPELFGWDLNHPMWREKHHGIQCASSIIAVSENTAKDLVKVFPEIPLDSVIVAKNGVDHQIFKPVPEEKIYQFRYNYGINKPYFLLVGAGSGYKNANLFFQAFSQLANGYGFDIVLTGSGGVLSPQFRGYTLGSTVHTLQLSDEELAIAYAGAIALVYPSKYEGFGMPILEAMACGCPVITCPNASLPEVAGEAAIYVNDDDVNSLADALCEVQKPSIRNKLVNAGLVQAKQFSWTKMAETISATLIDTSLLSLNLKEVNLLIIPDWSQSEESLYLSLAGLIKELANSSAPEKITLLISAANISAEDAELFLSSLAMSLLMEEEVDIEGIEISLLQNLAQIQWQALLPRIYARIVLDNEDQQVLDQVLDDKIKSLKIEEFMYQISV